MTFAERFLQPGIRLMQHMRLPAKFAVVCGCLLIPLGISTYGLMQYSDATIAFAEAERLGVAYTAPLNQMLQATALARVSTVDSITLERGAKALSTLEELAEKIRLFTHHPNELVYRFPGWFGSIRKCLKKKKKLAVVVRKNRYQ